MRSRTWSLVVVVAAACVAAIVIRSDFKPGRLWPWSRTGGEVVSGLGTEILMMRTPGGLLEVSAFRTSEQFSKKFVYSVLGMDVGETVAHIRVPAVFRYHIELAPEWEVYRKDEVFKVISPPIKPTLPVAVDLKHMEEDSGGTPILIIFNKDEDLRALRREITGVLAKKAGSDAYLKLQRDDARKTVTEFVEKWLVTQQSWKAADKPRVEVVFGE